MSMENAILELAAAMRENTAALLKASEATVHSTDAYKAAMLSYNSSSNTPMTEQDPVDAKAAEPADATAKRATAAREAQEKDAAANAEAKKPLPDEHPLYEEAAVEAKRDAEIEAELEAAVTKVEDDAKEAAPLDYAKDVKPVLLALVKAKKKPALVDLLAKYNAKNGEQIRADDFAAIVADANALIAA